MVSKLQDTIETNGRYRRTLDAISIGYSAAKGISQKDAKMEINAIFEKSMGVGIHEFLENQREAEGLPVGKSNTPSHSL